MKLTKCEVGLFKLPGIVIEKEKDEVIDEKLLDSIDEWCKSEQGTGVRMTSTLWSFRKESQRDWFILRWSDLKP